MNHHTDIINYLIQAKGLKSYLEIGVHNKEHNFNKIMCQTKVGIDPDPATGADFLMTSDHFFSLVHNVFDIIFIDGLHHSDQVKKDLENGMAHLKEGGFIVLHDTNPHSERITHVPRDNGEWCGDVYKAIVALYGGVEYKTLPFDYGITIIKKQELIFWEYSGSWEDFDKNRSEWLHIVSQKEFEEWI